MWSTCRACLWRYEEGRDPQEMELWKNMGKNIFVSRGSQQVLNDASDEALIQSMLKNIISVDPGETFFKVCRNAATGDTFYICPMLSREMRFLNKKISKVQSQMSKNVDKSGKVKTAKKKWIAAKNLFLLNGLKANEKLVYIDFFIEKKKLKKIR
jgi:hypothetical protein